MRLHLPALVALALASAGCGTVPAVSGAAASANRLAATSDNAPAQKSHLYSTVDILGIGSVYAGKLQAVGISRAIDLLEAGRSRTGRARLAAETGISAKLLLRWINHADLIRILQTGPVYARMLEDAGVDTVAELARRNPVNLRDSLEFVREKGGKTMVERVPSLQTVTEWVRRANDLGRYVDY